MGESLCVFTLLLLALVASAASLVSIPLHRFKSVRQTLGEVDTELVVAQPKYYNGAGSTMPIPEPLSNYLDET